MRLCGQRLAHSARENASLALRNFRSPRFRRVIRQSTTSMAYTPTWNSSTDFFFRYLPAGRSGMTRSVFLLLSSL